MPREASLELERHRELRMPLHSVGFHEMSALVLTVCFYISVLFCSLRNHIYLHISLAPSDPLFEIWRTDNLSAPIGWGFTPNAANSMGERNGNIHVTYTSFHIHVTTEAHPEGGRKSLEKGDCRMNRHPKIVYYRGIYRNIDHGALRSSFIYVSSW